MKKFNINNIEDPVRFDIRMFCDDDSPIKVSIELSNSKSRINSKSFCISQLSLKTIRELLLENIEMEDGHKLLILYSEIMEQILKGILERIKQNKIPTIYDIKQLESEKNLSNKLLYIFQKDSQIYHKKHLETMFSKTKQND